MLSSSASAAGPSTRLLRKPQVKAIVGKSSAQIDRDERAGKFPRRVQTGPNSVAWVADEIDAWIRDRIAERNAGTARLRPMPVPPSHGRLRQ